jgi:hypothetical protein
MDGTGRAVPCSSHRLADNVRRLGRFSRAGAITEEHGDIDIERLRDPHEPGRTDASCAAFEQLYLAKACSDRRAELRLRYIAFQAQRLNHLPDHRIYGIRLYHRNLVVHGIRTAFSEPLEARLQPSLISNRLNQ